MLGLPFHLNRNSLNPALKPKALNPNLEGSSPPPNRFKHLLMAGTNISPLCGGGPAYHPPAAAEGLGMRVPSKGALFVFHVQSSLVRVSFFQFQALFIVLGSEILGI